MAYASLAGLPPETELFFANARWFHKTVRSHVRDQMPPVREILVHAGAVPYLDTTAAAMLTKLIAELSDAGIELDFARVTTSLHSDLERNGIVGLLGRGHFHDTVAARVADFLARDSEART
jgi:SulP family sulfate permease